MKNLQQWLTEYSESHQHPTNIIIHKFAVPLIVMSLLGMIWCLPFPKLSFMPWFNWSLLISLLAILFYLSLSISMALGMTLYVILQSFLFFWLEPRLPTPLWLLMLVIFAVAWVLQFIGHHIEGKRPSFFQDVRFLLIGPLWVLFSLYKKLGLYRST
jgi:uncharacterized membrane protein YGL010W